MTRAYPTVMRSTGRARRWTLFGLGAVAVLGVLTALAFVIQWTRHVRDLEPTYFLEQGALWGRDYRRQVEEEIGSYLDQRAGAIARDWREMVQARLYRWFEDEFASAPHRRPLELTVLARDEHGVLAPLVALGRTPSVPADVAFTPVENEPLEVAVLDRGDLMLVLVRGPLSLREPIGDDALAFRMSLEFAPLQIAADAGVRLAVVLVVVYLLMLYGILIAVYLLGRREMAFAHAAREKEIRLRAMASVAEGIAHEVRNPLNAISLMVQYLERLQDLAGETRPAPQDFQRVYMELGKIRKVIDNFVSFAKLREIELTDWNLAEAVDEALGTLGARLAERRIVVARHASGDLDVRGDRAKIVQVVRNVVQNALEALAEMPEPVMHVTLEGRQKDVRIAIRDNGESPSEHVLANMFDPYFTTRTSAMGLGLTLAKTVVESHGGTVQAAAAAGGGCVVTLVIPRHF